MTSRENSASAVVAILLASLWIVSATQRARAQMQPSSAPAILKIAGSSVATPLSLSTADLKAMPRKTLKVENPHDKKTEVYEGVLLSDLFHKAGAPRGHQLRGPTMTTYVLAEAADGYKVIFSLAELDSDFTDADAIVADTLDGAPLGANEGPFKLVVPHDKRPARWVRMLQSLSVSQLSK
jgi:hypothetical protein